MDFELRQLNQRVAIGCGILALVSAFLIAGAILALVAQERQIARYPQSVPLSSHSAYSVSSRQFRWDNSYRTTDSFLDVYRWYSIRFELGSESRAHGKCIHLDGSQQLLSVRRYTIVILCDTPEARLIYVTRSTSFWP